MIKYDSENKSLVIALNDRTRAKVFSLAALSGKTVEEILHDSLSQLSDQILVSLEDKLSHEIVAQLEELDGKKIFPDKVPPQQGPAADHDADDGVDYEQDGELNAFSHQLSGDEDEGDNRSLAEQAETNFEPPPPPPPKKAAAPKAKPKATPARFVDENEDSPFQFNNGVPDVGSDADAFLDAAMDSENDQGRVVRRSQQSGISRAFNPQKRKARVSEFTGDIDSTF